ncbi:zinc finger odd-paired-like (opl) [Fusarium agapanthi]|uniref:Zinc finger odd-paired-like (Opl) n=1 Tax=Fusarium agapanthi TaxID=1803897 RepID=A0A9P5AX47_9HYPO|nr:zinc finger odd-paired-like (opl) [Fusarium agapanthi]
MAQYDSFLGFKTQEPLAMEHPSVPRSYEMNLGDGEDFDEWYMVPDNSSFVAHYEYPRMPSFTEDYNGAPYFTPQTTQQFDINFGFSSVEKGDFLVVNHPVMDVDPLMRTPMPVDDEYILRDSHQSFEMPLATPSSVASAPENPSWGLVAPTPVESVWDLSALHPDSCNISDRRNSEPLDLSGASTPKLHSHDEHRESSALLALSLMDSFRYPCPQKSCSKTFKRKEHAKRHYMTRQAQAKDMSSAVRVLRPARNGSAVHFVPEALQMLQKVQKPTSYNAKLHKPSEDVQSTGDTPASILDKLQPLYGRATTSKLLTLYEVSRVHGGSRRSQPRLSGPGFSLQYLEFKKFPSVGIDDITFPMKMQKTPREDGLYFAQQFGWKGINDIGYIGLQPRPDKNGRQVIHAAFSSFQKGTTSTHKHCTAGADGGPGVSCKIDIYGNYSHLQHLTVKHIGGTRWRGVLTDTVARTSNVIGEYTLPSSARKLTNGQVGFMEYYVWNDGEKHHNCTSQHFGRVFIGDPTTKTSGASGGKISDVYQAGECVNKLNLKATRNPHGYQIQAGFKQ